MSTKNVDGRVMERQKYVNNNFVMSRVSKFSFSFFQKCKLAYNKEKTQQHVTLKNE